MRMIKTGLTEATEGAFEEMGDGMCIPKAVCRISSLVERNNTFFWAGNEGPPIIQRWFFIPSRPIVSHPNWDAGGRPMVEKVIYLALPRPHAL